MIVRTVKDLEKAYPELVNQIKQEAINDERARIQALDAMNDPNNPELNTLINEAKKSGIVPKRIEKIADSIKGTNYMTQCLNKAYERGR